MCFFHPCMQKFSVKEDWDKYDMRSTVLFAKCLLIKYTMEIKFMNKQVMTSIWASYRDAKVGSGII